MVSGVNPPVDLYLTVGDRRRSFARTLQNADGSPVRLTGLTCMFRMVNTANKQVKVDDAPAVILEVEGDPATWGKVRYDWAAVDVDTPGNFWVWFIVADGVRLEHYPYDPHRFCIQFVATP
jgi:hypothetical protein